MEYSCSLGLKNYSVLGFFSKSENNLRFAQPEARFRLLSWVQFPSVLGGAVQERLVIIEPMCSPVNFSILIGAEKTEESYNPPAYKQALFEKVYEEPPARDRRELTCRLAHVPSSLFSNTSNCQN